MRRHSSALIVALAVLFAAKAAFGLLTGAQFATNAESSYSYAMEHQPKRVEILDPNLLPDPADPVDTNCPNVDCNYVDTNGNCIQVPCPPTPAFLTLTWKVPYTEPSLGPYTTGVQHSFDLVNWSTIALVTGTNTLTIPNAYPVEFFRVFGICGGMSTL